MVSIPVVPKLSPNHVRIGSRKERLGEEKKKKKKKKQTIFFFFFI